MEFPRLSKTRTNIDLRRGLHLTTVQRRKKKRGGSEHRILSNVADGARCRKGMSLSHMVYRPPLGKAAGGHQPESAKAASFPCLNTQQPRCHQSEVRLFTTRDKKRRRSKNDRYLLLYTRCNTRLAKKPNGKCPFFQKSFFGEFK